jgi:hypothetical protein
LYIERKSTTFTYGLLGQVMRFQHISFKLIHKMFKNNSPMFFQ